MVGEKKRMGGGSSHPYVPNPEPDDGPTRVNDMGTVAAVSSGGKGTAKTTDKKPETKPTGTRDLRPVPPTEYNPGGKGDKDPTDIRVKTAGKYYGEVEENSPFIALAGRGPMVFSRSRKKKKKKKHARIYVS